jgi:hypothetical protein
MADGRWAQMREPILGLFGLNAMEPFETIIDYPHQLMLLIRLDSLGHRMATIPSYTPRVQVPLVAVASPGTPDQQYWWGVMGNLGGTDSATPDTLQLDTGDPDNSLVRRTYARLTAHSAHLTPTTARPDDPSATRVMLDRMTVGGTTLTMLPFSLYTADCDILGYGYLSRLGVVGFNLRTRQFLLYR